MLPKRAEIKNFRSIGELTVDFDPSCLVLLGINETGKSNILRALSLMSPTAKMTPDDVRQVGSAEDLPGEAYVRFTFEPDSAQLGAIAQDLDERVFGPDEPIARLDDTSLRVPDLAQRFAKALLYYADVRNSRRYPSYFRLPERLQVASDWMSPAPTCPPNHEIVLPSGESIRAKACAAVHRSFVPADFPEHLLIPFARSHLDAWFAAACSAFVNSNLPECISRTFTTDDGLPATVGLDDFLAAPTAWPALFNMFQLASVRDPKEALRGARTRANGVRTLLDRVADSGTTYVRSVWKEFADLKIELHENGPALDCVIRDVKGVYNFSRRSDGFRRFVSFLLQVSSRMPARDLEGAFLLYDEPDTSLHPTGARQLRDELVRLSDKNIVVFSTHSIFMVDPDKLERHLIVNRVQEVTKVQRAKPAMVRDEEVLYNAIGHSIFSVLGPMNLLLEGHRDKLVFDAVLAQDAKLSERYARVGLCHAGGVKQVSKITPLLQMAGRQCLVVSDGDRPALEARDKYAGHANWRTYVELIGTRFVTAEDLLQHAHVNATLAALGPRLPQEFALLSSVAVSPDEPVMKQLGAALAAGGMPPTLRNAALDHVKTALFNDLRPDLLVREARELVIAVRDLLSEDERNVPVRETSDAELLQREIEFLRSLGTTLDASPEQLRQRLRLLHGNLSEPTFDELTRDIDDIAKPAG